VSTAEMMATMRNAVTHTIGSVLTVAIVVLSLSLGMAGIGQASPVECGGVIDEDTVLNEDIGPCADGGLVVGADNVTLDLDGHSVFGTMDYADGVGILVSGRVGVTVTGGTVRQFDAGIYIEGGGLNEVSDMIIRDNGSTNEEALRRPGRPLALGDGVAINSSANVIRHNVVVRNGPNDGIGLFANSRSNTIEHNVVIGNNTTIGERSIDDGIRLDYAVRDNLVVRNDVRRNGHHGIAVYGFADSNTIRANVVKRNGYPTPDQASSGAIDGSGIYIAATDAVVRSNVVLANAIDGIRIDGTSNRIVDNRTARNGTGGGGYDLHDTNADPPCDHNHWSRNRFDMAFPDCAEGPEAPLEAVRSSRSVGSVAILSR
jgi:parallel beta-helix repeat protein